MLNIVHLHPMVIHFPIALFGVSVLFEIIYLINKDSFYRRAAFYLFTIAALGVAAAVFTGNLAEEVVENEAIERFLEAHEEAGQFTLIVVILTFLVRVMLQILDKYYGWYHSLFLLLMAISLILLIRAAYLGGELVYTHGVGVQTKITGTETGQTTGKFYQKNHEDQEDE